MNEPDPTKRKYPPLRPKPAMQDQQRIDLQRLRPLMNRWGVAAIFIFLALVITGAEASLTWLTASRTPVHHIRGPR